MYYDRTGRANNQSYQRKSWQGVRGGPGGGGNARNDQRMADNRYNNGAGGGRGLANDLPLRMVVNAKYVGAIIGQGGSNIRQVTKESKARCVVDVTRTIREGTGNIVEKAINIYGNPENCSQACMKILDIVLRESQNDPNYQGRTVEPELKLLAHNNLVGRLIGKGGSTIKRIMEDSACTVFVSNISELSSFNMERTITVRGSVANIAKAEAKISMKLRQCWEHDMNNTLDAMYCGGGHPLMATPPLYGADSPLAGAYPPYAAAAPVQSYQRGNGGMTMNHRQAAVGPMNSSVSSRVAASPNDNLYTNHYGQQNNLHTEVVHVWVPNTVVGALIGTKGAHIRQVMRVTGAHIRIESTKPESEQAANANNQPQQQQQKKEKDIEKDRQQDRNSERRVTITGTDLQQYKSQFWVFQRVCEQSFMFFDEVRLCTEVQVPSRMVGRIIGKRGQNVRELQRYTGAQVKIPEDPDGNTNAEDSVVRIVGNFNASQAVQARIRQLLYQFSGQPQLNHAMGENGGLPSNRRPEPLFPRSSGERCYVPVGSNALSGHYNAETMIKAS